MTEAEAISLSSPEEDGTDVPRALLLFAIGSGRVLLPPSLGRGQSQGRGDDARVRGEQAYTAVAAACLALRLLPGSIVPYWDLATGLASRQLRRRASPGGRGSPVREAFLNGPLGPGASKAVSVLAAFLLWRAVRGEWPKPLIFGTKVPGLFELGILIVISLGVNGVLYAWSRMANSRGDHEGVQRMVSSSRGGGGPCLTSQERLLYGTLALANAFCEEVVFRWFWRAEFASCLPDDEGGRLRSNLAQAALFGVMHYRGIPSGAAGVVMTFVYGAIMGALADGIGGGGLLLPIAAHTVADYYIFASVARGKAVRHAKNDA